MMKRPVCSVLIVILCIVLNVSGVTPGVPAARAAETGTWTQLPLYGGSIYCLAIDPKTPTTMYADTLNGLYRSTDGGATWTVVKTEPKKEGLSSLSSTLIRRPRFMPAVLVRQLEMVASSAPRTVATTGLR